MLTILEILLTITSLLALSLLAGLPAGFAVFISSGTNLLGTIGKVLNKLFGGNRPEFRDEVLEQIKNRGTWASSIFFELLLCEACQSVWFGMVFSFPAVMGLMSQNLWWALIFVWPISALIAYYTRTKLEDCVGCKKASSQLKELKEKRLKEQTEASPEP